MYIPGRRWEDYTLGFVLEAPSAAPGILAIDAGSTTQEQRGRRAEGGQRLDPLVCGKIRAVVILRLQLEAVLLSSESL